MTLHANISLALRERALEAPERVAMHYPCGARADGGVAYRSITYAELERDVAHAAAGLEAIGVGRGVRAALMVKPGPEFFVLMFGLLRAGAVPVLIDPGIDKRALKACLAEAAPAAFIGIPLAHLARLLLGWARGSVRTLVTVGRRWLWSGYSYADVLARGAAEAAASVAPTQADDLAAILFTSGSTGVPKGVEYTHANFAAQVELIRAAFDIRPGEIDLPTFPPFALFDPALGMTTVLPQMDFARPARADPRNLIQAIDEFGVTTMFGSPALLDTLSRHGEAHGTRLKTLARVLSAGAPVTPAVVARMRALLPAHATLWTPYGATECLPVAVVEGREILDVGRAATADGAGILVGRPLAANTVRVIRIDDGPIAQWSDALLVPPRRVGEITVAGPTTTNAYFRRDRATALAKIADGGRVVHRMGDLGYFDDDGRLWYCGRKSHRVETAAGALYSECVEGVFNAHPGVRRTALVGIGAIGSQLPVLCVELAEERTSWTALRDALAALALSRPDTRAIRHFIAHPRFPVDIRHNAKIGREKLACWAAPRVALAAPAAFDAAPSTERP